MNAAQRQPAPYTPVTAPATVAVSVLVPPPVPASVPILGSAPGQAPPDISGLVCPTFAAVDLCFT